MADSKTKLPQEGTTQCGKSLPEHCSQKQSLGSPSDSGGGNFRSYATGVSRDVSTPLVGNQAKVFLKMTGMKSNNKPDSGESKKLSEVDAFSPVRSLARSPPRSQSCGDISIKDNPEVTEEKRGVKRPRTPSPKEANDLNLSFGSEIHELIKKLQKEVNNLIKTVEDQPNVKKEVKNNSMKVQNATRKLAARQIEDWFSNLAAANLEGHAFKHRSVGSMVCQTTQTNDEEIPETASTSTQTVGQGRLEEDNLIELITSKLDEDLNPKKMEELIQMNWPSRTFKYTSRSRRSILTASEDAARAILYYTDDIERNGIIASFYKQYPAIKSLMKAGKLNEKDQFVVLSSKDNITVNESANSDTQTKIVALYGLNRQNGEEEQTSQIMEAICKIGKTLDVNGYEKCIVALPPNSDANKMQKIIEYCGKKTEKKFHLWLGKRKDVEKKAFPKRRIDRRKKDTNTIIVHTDKKDSNSYAAIVREMKANINPEDAGTQVQRISKTIDGNIRLEIKERKKGGGRSLIEEIKQKVKSVVNIGMKSNKCTVIISNLDDTCTQDEIKDALANRLKEPELNEENVKVHIWENKNGGKTASVEIDIELAKPLLEDKYIKVGWLHCKIAERIQLDQCFRCNMFGHRAKDCQAPETLEKMCLRCGETGHIARTCERERHCFICNVDGHRADSMACPDYRKKVNEIKTQRERKIIHLHP